MKIKYNTEIIHLQKLEKMVVTKKSQDTALSTITANDWKYRYNHN